MARPAWFNQIVKQLYVARVPLAKLTKLPVIGSLVHAVLFDSDETYYLPKDNVIPIYEHLEEPEQLVLPSQIVDHFIERSSYRMILNTCICRETSQCEDYPIDLGCLLLGDSVLAINPKLGRLVSKAEAKEHARRCREAGLVHMIGRSKMDQLWLGAPRKQLMTICNCCPCCCVWRVIPHLSPRLGDKVRRMPGVEVKVTDACVGCGLCTQAICFVEAISLVDGVAHISDACRGCGRCVEVCPHGAIELRVDSPELDARSGDRDDPAADTTRGCDPAMVMRARIEPHKA